jgi:ATP-dependent 26S proteasome regulatory subunit
LILEDAETLMLDRERYKGKETANLLNLTDGLIGEMLQLKIIATLNTEEKIDKAFLRKGRLKQKVDFKPLEVTQAIQLAASLGKSVNIQKPTVLTDIYNAEDNGVTDTKQSIGFKSHG